MKLPFVLGQVFFRVRSNVFRDRASVFFLF